jgi:V/A-type H+-transporting ATPase subunit I
MAIVQMKKLRLLGLKSEKDAVISALFHTRAFEFKSTEDFEGLTKGVAEIKDDLPEKISRLQLCINLIEDSIKEIQKYRKKKEKKPFFTVKGNVSFDDFKLVSAREYEIFSYVEKLEKLNSLLTGLRSEQAKQTSLIEQIKIFKDIDAPLNLFSDTLKTSIMLGTLPSESLNSFKEYFSSQENCEFEIYGGGSSVAAVVIFPQNEKNVHAGRLSALGFTRASFAYDESAARVIDKCNKNIEEITAKKINVLDNIINLRSKLGEIKLLFDYFSLENIKREYEKQFNSSAHMFMLEGFVPAEYTEKVEKALSEKTRNTVIEFLDTEEKDNPPTYTKNPAITAPFQSVINMYSVPHPDEKDPNNFVAIFFVIFFGIMMGDAGYGLLLAIGATLLLRKARMEKGMSNIIKIIAIGGVSTFIWGLLLGGWFGIDLDSAGGVVAGFLKSLRWFSPMQQPLMMLGLCLGLGVIQILFGLGIKAAELIKKGKTAEALMDVGCWYLFFASTAVVCAGMALNSKIVSDTGLYALFSSLGVIVITQGRKGKGIFGKALKGFAGLYGIVGYLSDILSYARLFGLGLASGVIALVMNTIAGMLFAEWYLALFGVVILIGGHAFNIGINVLGAYIHDCRLQYIEFFSRFYTGGGHVFVPYGTDLKYYHVVD